MLAGAGVLFAPEAEVSLDAFFLPGFDVAGFPAFVQDFIFSVPFIHQFCSAPEGKARVGQPKDHEDGDQAECAYPMSIHSVSPAIRLLFI